MTALKKAVLTLRDLLFGDVLTETEADDLLEFAHQCRVARDAALKKAEASRASSVDLTHLLDRIGGRADDIVAERDRLAAALIVALRGRGEPLTVQRDDLDPTRMRGWRLVWENDMAQDCWRLAAEEKAGRKSGG